MLFRPETKESFELQYPEAALWDFLSRGIPRERLVGMMSVLQCSTPRSAEQWVELKITEWLRSGWLIEGDQSG